MVSVCAILLPDPPEKPVALPPVNAAVQVNVAVPILLVNVMLVASPLHMASDEGVAITVT